MVSYVFRLLGLVFWISFLSCSNKTTSAVLKEDRIKLTKYKREIENVYNIQNNYKNKIPVLLAKLKVANTPREKGKIVTQIQRFEKKLKRCKEKTNILKTKIIELENKGVTPLE